MTFRFEAVPSAYFLSMGPGRCGRGRGGVFLCPRCPGPGARAQSSLCSWGDAGSPPAAGSQPGLGRLPAGPWNAEIPARTRPGAPGKQPCPRARANKWLGACPDAKVMGTSPGEQWGWRGAAVGTGQRQQPSSPEVSGGGKRGTGGGGTAAASMGATLIFQKLGGPVPARCWSPVPADRGRWLTPEMAFCCPHWVRGLGAAGSSPQPLGHGGLKLGVPHPVHPPAGQTVQGKEPAAAGGAGARAERAVMGGKGFWGNTALKAGLMQGGGRMDPCLWSRGRACVVASPPFPMPGLASGRGAAGFLCHGGSSWLGRWEQGSPGESTAWWDPVLRGRHPCPQHAPSSGSLSGMAWPKAERCTAEPDPSACEGSHGSCPHVAVGAGHAPIWGSAAPSAAVCALRSPGASAELGVPHSTPAPTMGQARRKP